METYMKTICDSAVFSPAQEGGYNVSFPHYPGCVTFGRTLDEAHEKAEEVLELWLEEIDSIEDTVNHDHSRKVVVTA